MAALFHLAFPVHDLTAAKRFYVDGLGCVLGRESSTAVTFGLAGHQLVAHLAPSRRRRSKGSIRDILDSCSPRRRSGRQWSIVPGAWGSRFTSNRGHDSRERRSNIAPSFWKIPLITCSSSNITALHRPSSANEPSPRSETPTPTRDVRRVVRVQGVQSWVRDSSSDSALRRPLEMAWGRLPLLRSNQRMM